MNSCHDIVAYSTDSRVENKTINGLLILNAKRVVKKIQGLRKNSRRLVPFCG
jgi:hypothetical protein